MAEANTSVSHIDQAKHRLQHATITEARWRAQRAVKRALQAQGLKLGSVSHRDMGRGAPCSTNYKRRGALA
jgi:hypothetical protein